MKTQRTVSRLALALLASSFLVPSVKAWEKPSALAGAALFCFGSYILLNKRRPEKNAKPRYDVKKLRDFSNPIEYANNLWYLYYDGFIGQKSSSSKVKAGPDNKLHVSEPAEPFGFLGNANDYVKPIKESKEALIGLGLAWAFINKIDVITEWIYPSNDPNKSTKKPSFVFNVDSKNFDFDKFKECFTQQPESNNNNS